MCSCPDPQIGVGLVLKLQTSTPRAPHRCKSQHWLETPASSADISAAVSCRYLCRVHQTDKRRRHSPQRPRSAARNPLGDGSNAHIYSCDRLPVVRRLCSGSLCQPAFSDCQPAPIRRGRPSRRRRQAATRSGPLLRRNHRRETLQANAGTQPGRLPDGMDIKPVNIRMRQVLITHGDFGMTSHRACNWASHHR